MILMLVLMEKKKTFKFCYNRQHSAPGFVSLPRTYLASLQLVHSKYQKFHIFNPLNTKRRLLYLKTQFVPRSKHFSSRL